jgi:hypothetical protein
MCVVSMVTQHYWERFPQPSLFPINQYKDFMEILRKAAEYDRIMNQPDCPDPMKQDWLDQVKLGVVRRMESSPVNLYSMPPYTPKSEYFQKQESVE